MRKLSPLERQGQSYINSELGLGREEFEAFGLVRKLSKDSGVDSVRLDSGNEETLVEKGKIYPIVIRCKNREIFDEVVKRYFSGHAGFTVHGREGNYHYSLKTLGTEIHFALDPHNGN